MDAFFASVEIRDDPSLRGKPVLVGGTGRRAVISAASYEARRFGCRSAQPTTEALRRCPDAIVVAPRHRHYVAVSARVFEIFGRYTPLVEGLSIDEAFLDVTASQRLLGSARAIAQAIRADVARELQLTCSVGISTTKFIAKIASSVDKPDGLTEVEPGRELEFLHPLPVGELWGVGPRAAERLAALGVRTIGDLARVGETRLAELFGEHGRQLHRLAHAVDERDVVPGHAPKSIGHEDTFADDLVGEAAIRSHLLAQATRVADRLVHAGLRGRVVQIKIRDVTLRTETRQMTLEVATDDARRIYRHATDLLRGLDIGTRRVRLTGVSVRGLSSARPSVGDQLELPVGEGDARGRSLQSVVTAVRDRYGKRALYPAAAAGPSATGAVVWSRDALDPEEPDR
jgi:DNA polymerase-4